MSPSGTSNDYTVLIIYLYYENCQLVLCVKIMFTAYNRTMEYYVPIKKSEMELFL